MHLGVMLLSVYEVRELGGVTDEEHGRVVEHPVEVALLSLDLDRETCPFVLNSCPKTESKCWRHTTGITRRVCGTGLATDSRETDCQRSCSSWSGSEELGAGEVGDGVGEGECSMGSSALGMDDTLWNALTVEVGEKVDVMEIWERYERL